MFASGYAASAGVSVVPTFALLVALAVSSFLSAEATTATVATSRRRTGAAIRAGGRTRACTCVPLLALAQRAPSRATEVPTVPVPLVGWAATAWLVAA